MNNKGGIAMENELNLDLLAQKVAQLEKDSERNSTQHREFYNSLKDIEVKLQVSDNTMQNMFSVLSEIKDDVKELKEKPVKKWDSVSMYVMTTVIGGLIGFLINLAF